jgi:hypothetical protein
MGKIAMKNGMLTAYYEKVWRGAPTRRKLLIEKLRTVPGTLDQELFVDVFEGKADEDLLLECEKKMLAVLKVLTHRLDEI